MLANFYAALPFTFLVPLESKFVLRSFAVDGYEVTFDIPRKSEIPTQVQVDQIKVDGKPAIAANVAVIRFRKDSFDRRNEGPDDPPPALLQAALDEYLARLRYATGGYQIVNIDLQKTRWRLRFTHDDGSELASEDGYYKEVGVLVLEASYVVCDPTTWENMFALPSGFRPPSWHPLLLDAKNALPHIGSSIVLTATAMEVFINSLLDKLVEESSMSTILWKWINDRGNWQREPSVVEQYDVLLKELTGHTLKENNELWEAFTHIRAARNSFAHEGCAVVAKKPVNVLEAANLISKAEAIFLWIRQWIPEEKRWPVFQYSSQVEIVKEMLGSKPGQDDI
jgi:hypothetical protein